MLYSLSVKLKESSHSRQATENNSFIAEALKYLHIDVPISMPISNLLSSPPTILLPSTLGSAVGVVHFPC